MHIANGFPIDIPVHPRIPATPLLTPSVRGVATLAPTTYMNIVVDIIQHDTLCNDLMEQHVYLYMQRFSGTAQERDE